jgi:hypothetical protein
LIVDCGGWLAVRQVAGCRDGGFRGLLPLEKTNLRAQRRDLILFSRRALPRREETAETEEENG